MTKFFRTGLLLMAMTISLVACRDTDTVEDDEIRTEADADVNVNEDGSKVKIKTDDTKIKIETDDEGNVTKKVKTDNDDN